MIRFFYKSNDLIPYKKRIEDAGWDLRSAIDIEIKPGETKIIPTGVSMMMGYRYVGLVLARSSFAAKGINVTGGVIDSSYRGEIRVILQNFGKETLKIRRGDRIAQIVVFQIANFADEILFGEAPKDTERGVKGFGSTGVR